MDVCSLAEAGDVEGLSIALLEGEGLLDLDQLGVVAIEADQPEVVDFLIHNGADADYLYDLALSLGKSDMVAHIEDLIGEISPEQETYTPIPISERQLSDAISRDDLDDVKDMLHERWVTINDVASMAARYGNRRILTYAIKYGANNYDDIIREARDNNHLDIARDIERHKEIEEEESI